MKKLLRDYSLINRHQQQWNRFWKYMKQKCWRRSSLKTRQIKVLCEQSQWLDYCLLPFNYLNIFILKKRNCEWRLSKINISIIRLIWVSQLMCFNQSGLIYLKTVFISRICCLNLVSAHCVCFFLVCAWQEFLSCCADNLTLVPGAYILSPVGPLGSSSKTFWLKKKQWQPEQWQPGLCSSYLLKRLLISYILHSYQSFDVWMKL